MSKPIPISQWLCQTAQNLPCRRNHIATETALSERLLIERKAIAFKGDQLLFAQDFMQRAADWLIIIDQHPGQRWAVYHSDSIEFLAIVLALWQRGKTACVPGDNQPGTIERLSQCVQQFAGDFQHKGAHSLPPQARYWQSKSMLMANDCQVEATDSLTQVQSREPWVCPDNEFPALEIYTSGSTGTPKAITKTLAQLELEIEYLGLQWPQLSQGGAGALTLSTVSHQHFYGLIFRLLLPLTYQQLIDSQICEYPEDIFYRVQQYRELSFQLISSPSHLSRLPENLEWDKLAGRCLGITSAAAPLQRQDSLMVQQRLGAKVREIYGSSETGVIAWRAQQYAEKRDALWQALPGIELRCDATGCLELRSPYADERDWFALPDRVELSDQGFKLLGRTDRIVKIEGKRVSLTAIEALLQPMPWVAQCRALVLEKKRVEMAVVVELTPEGWQYHQQQGKKQLVKVLKSQLQGHFETVMLPRRWRFVEQLPYNAQGKITQQCLTALFDTPELTSTDKSNGDQGVTDATLSIQQDGHMSDSHLNMSHAARVLINGQPATSDKWPVDIQISEDRRVEYGRQMDESPSHDENMIQLSCRIPVELIYFDGHFDGSPILPGIVQVHWAEAFGREYFPIQGQFVRLEQVKFQQVIKPDALITIELSYQVKNNKLSFSFNSEQGGHSSGRICFA